MRQSIERVDRVRDNEAEGRHDAGQLAAFSNASGIIVSASTVRIAPAAKASTKATVSGEESWNRA